MRSPSPKVDFAVIIVLPAINYFFLYLRCSSIINS
nr:MAG TPA: hypothetical protein [Crassvirales sp.]DAK96706.1 MAG TPA: hypothetical protein [Bacteriophage sp.]DAT29133.1 MAG TPA: hypothetical protein [Caudoviricetes sp.]